MVEDFYRRRGLPVRYQIAPVVEPPVLEERLAARGYVIEAPTLVQTAERRRTCSRRRPRPPPGVALEVADAIDDAWVAAYGRRTATMRRSYAA